MKIMKMKTWEQTWSMRMPVSYTHLDVYKRQIVLLSKSSKSVFISFVELSYV